jgi:hypothetical protein
MKLKKGYIKKICIICKQHRIMQKRRKTCSARCAKKYRDNQYSMRVKNGKK